MISVKGIELTFRYVSHTDDEKAEVYHKEKEEYEQKMNTIMIEIRKKFSVEPLTDEEMKDKKEGISSEWTPNHVERNSKSDRAASDSKVKTPEATYQKWIAEAYNKQR